MNTQRRNLILEIANPQDVEAQFRALGPNLASPDPSKMWKIQTGSVGGWADLKVSSEEDDVYVDDWYPTREAAEAEVLSMFGSKHGGPNGESGISGSPEDFRVVPADTPADDDLY
jgi:hypothetical protein